MDFKEVESSSIKAIGYDANKKELQVKFAKGNSTWSYTPVSQTDYDLFMSSSSLGSFFHKHIKLNPGITAQKI